MYRAHEEDEQSKLNTIVEVLKDRLYFSTRRTQPKDLPNVHFFTIDHELVYESFFADFGPPHIGHVHTFCQIVDAKLMDPRLRGRKLYLYTSHDTCKRTNAAFLVCAYKVVRLGSSAEEAFRCFDQLSGGFLPFRDASVGLSTFNITILDCLRALSRAVALNFFSYEKFNAEEYYFYEKVENGDLNWIVPGKFIAFSGPVASQVDSSGMRSFVPEDYIPLFTCNKVSTVVRLNKKEYDKTKFTANGISHFDLYFLDGSAPSDTILASFLQIAESQPSAIAVHCRAGLGRTGTLIAAYLMKHYRFSAVEAIAWVRLCRPGSIIGPQQHFLQDHQQRLWKAGEIFKKKVPISKRDPDEVDRISSSLKSLAMSSGTPKGHSYYLRERSNPVLIKSMPRKVNRTETLSSYPPSLRPEKILKKNGVTKRPKSLVVSSPLRASSSPASTTRSSRLLTRSNLRGTISSAAHGLDRSAQSPACTIGVGREINKP